jgi:hypothetical protein
MLNCAIVLKYKKPPKHLKTHSRISIIVKDERNNIERGGKDHNLVGRVWNGLGMPMDQKTKIGREPEIVIKELVSDCLESFGYEIVDTTNQIPKLYVNLNDFWFIFRRARIEAHFELKYNGNTLWQDSIISDNKRLNLETTQYIGDELSNTLEHFKIMLIENINKSHFQDKYNTYTNAKRD